MTCQTFIGRCAPPAFCTIPDFKGWASVIVLAGVFPSGRYFSVIIDWSEERRNYVILGVWTPTCLRVSTIGGGGDTTIPSPGMTPKQLLPGIGLHDPLHGRQACPEFNSFHQGVGQISSPEGLFSCRPRSKREQICCIPAPPPPIDERLFNLQRCSMGLRC